MMFTQLSANDSMRIYISDCRLFKILFIDDDHPRCCIFHAGKVIDKYFKTFIKARGECIKIKRGAAHG